MRTRTRRAAVDTSALLAIASPRDQYHARAVATEEQFREGGGRWIATTLVLGELHGHLIRRADPATARRVVRALLDDRAVEWVEVSKELIDGAVTQWLDRFVDQRFSLTDAVTFEVMRTQRLTRAFAYDRDFVTAGFELM